MPNRFRFLGGAFTLPSDKGIGRFCQAFCRFSARDSREWFQIRLGYIHSSESWLIGTVLIDPVLHRFPFEANRSFHCSGK